MVMINEWPIDGKDKWTADWLHGSERLTMCQRHAWDLGAASRQSRSAEVYDARGAVHRYHPAVLDGLGAAPDAYHCRQPILTGHDGRVR